MFKCPFLSKRSGAMLVSALSVVMVSNSALAANPEQVTLGAEFVTPFTLTEVNALNFGLLDVNLAAAETIAISTADGVTDANNRVLGGTQEAAEVTVAATASQAITITVDNASTPTGYTIGSFVCDYNGGGSAACGGGLSATSATSAALLIGATITGNGSAVVGTDDGTFDVTIAYD